MNTEPENMYAFIVTQDIAAAPARVWRALCDPAEVVQWDTGVAAALDAPLDYPQPGQHVRWRYTNGPFRILHDRPQEVLPERRLRSLLRVGPFRFDETYTLAPQAAGCRLTATLEVRAPVPVLSWFVERAYLGPRTRAAVAASLAAIKRRCEAG
jgi:uncharacterized protein YndB with AHSA1/START domain